MYGDVPTQTLATRYRRRNLKAGMRFDIEYLCLSFHSFSLRLRESRLAAKSRRTLWGRGMSQLDRPGHSRGTGSASRSALDHVE